MGRDALASWHHCMQAPVSRSWGGQINARAGRREARERELLSAYGQLGDANEVLNERAVAVMKRMSDKLTGRDFLQARHPLWLRAARICMCHVRRACMLALHPPVLLRVPGCSGQCALVASAWGLTFGGTRARLAPTHVTVTRTVRSITVCSFMRMERGHAEGSS